MAEGKEPTFSFGPKEKRLITDPLNGDNPITVQVLGICSALAVTTLVNKAIVMAIATIFVTVFANLIISTMRKMIPGQVRMIVQLVVIATLVTIVELTLRAINYSIYKELSVFIGLIITNCIVMGRLEAFALANKPWKSVLDGFGNGLGYGLILIIVAAIREFFGKGALMGYKIIGNTPDYLIDTTDSVMFGWYTSNNLMVLFPSAMFVIGVVIWVHRAWNPKLVDVS